MVRNALVVAAAMIALSASVAAVGLLSSSPYQQGATTTSAEAVRDLLPLVAMVALLTAVAFIYGQLRHPNNLAAFVVLCAADGVLLYLLHGDDGTRPRAVGAAAAHVLPAAATATFFLGMALVFVHGSGAVPAGDGAPVWILIKLALGAAAVVIGLMALALYG